MARIVTHDQYDVIVIGGGASGLAAALAAARAGARTAVIERDVACGLPILATGNGRCNLSNTALDPARYRHPDIAQRVMGKHPESELDAWFASIGLMTCCEGELIFPLSKRAESVRDALLRACERAKVQLLPCYETVRASWQDASATWKLDVLVPTSPLRATRARDAKSELRAKRKALSVAPKCSNVLHARAIILAPGGAGGSTCQLFDVPHHAEEPVLCPIACTPAEELARAGADVLARLDGLRVEADAQLIRNGRPMRREHGEVLFRTYGLSGVVIFNLSRTAEPGDALELDLFPHATEQELSRAFTEREHIVGELSRRAYTWFDGVLAPALGKALVVAGDGNVQACSHLAKHLDFVASGRTETRAAQVRRGGIPFNIVSLPDLSLACAPSSGTLFACGEALDMDADCGGFNLAWAWLSGQRAGNAAASAALC